MVNIDTVKVKAYDLKVGDSFLDVDNNIWEIKRIENADYDYLNLWFDNLEGTESFYPFRGNETVFKVVENVAPPLSSMPDPLNSDVDEPSHVLDAISTDLPGLSATPVEVNPSEKFDKGTLIPVYELRPRDRFSCKHQVTGEQVELGIIASIKILENGVMLLTFTDGNVEAFHDSQELVTLLERNCVIDNAVTHVGQITLVLRLDNNPDAKNAALTYAIAIQNSNPDLSSLIKSLVS